MGDLVVDYATADGTAHSAVDYTATTGHLTFAPGETSKTISIPIIDNTLRDGTRTFTVALTGPDLGATRTLSITIANDDQPTGGSTSSSGGGGGGGGGGSMNWSTLWALALALLLLRRTLRRPSQNLSPDSDVPVRGFNLDAVAPIP